MRSVVDYLKTHPQSKVAIVGYTDSSGNDAANLRLSERCATAVMNRMASRGIEKSRMTAEGYGERDPVADNSTREGRLRNRRVEIKVTTD